MRSGAADMKPFAVMVEQMRKVERIWSRRHFSKSCRTGTYYDFAGGGWRKRDSNGRVVLLQSTMIEAEWADE